MQRTPFDHPPWLPFRDRRRAAHSMVERFKPFSVTLAQWMREIVERFPDPQIAPAIQVIFELASLAEELFPGCWELIDPDQLDDPDCLIKGREQLLLLINRPWRVEHDPRLSRALECIRDLARRIEGWYATHRQILERAPEARIATRHVPLELYDRCGDQPCESSMTTETEGIADGLHHAFYRLLTVFYKRIEARDDGRGPAQTPAADAQPEAEVIHSLQLRFPDVIRLDLPPGAPATQVIRLADWHRRRR